MYKLFTFAHLPFLFEAYFTILRIPFELEAGPIGRAPLRRSFTAARLLRSWVRVPPGTLMSVCCECCVLSGKGLWDELITRPEESYRLWCVVVCDLETTKILVSYEEVKAL